MTHHYDSSASGYILDSFEGISQTFTDVEILSTSEVNVVAKAKRYGRWWLLKGLRKEVAAEAGYQQRLRKELEILMLLQHPNVVAAYGIEVVEGLGRCIVMEYVDGVTLKEWLAEKPSRRMRLRVMQEMADAVAASVSPAPCVAVADSPLQLPPPCAVLSATTSAHSV